MRYAPPAAGSIRTSVARNEDDAVTLPQRFVESLASCDSCTSRGAASRNHCCRDEDRALLDSRRWCGARFNSVQRCFRSARVRRSSSGRGSRVRCFARWSLMVALRWRDRRSAHPLARRSHRSAHDAMKNAVVAKELARDARIAIRTSHLRARDSLVEYIGKSAANQTTLCCVAASLEIARTLRAVRMAPSRMSLDRLERCSHRGCCFERTRRADVLCRFSRSAP